MMERSHLTPNTIQILLAAPKGAFQYTSHMKSLYSLGTCKTLLVLDFTFSLCVCVGREVGGGGHTKDPASLATPFKPCICSTRLQYYACLPATKSYWKPCKR